MNTDEFIENYWCHYIMIEKEFCEIFEYITLDKENENAFSHAYSKIILKSAVKLTLLYVSIANCWIQVLMEKA